MRNDDSSQAADDTSNGFDDEAYSEVPGVGLGLYLVQSLVIQIGAEIKVESAGVGETSGTKFTILLPAADSPH